ncbi:MAG TPA: hypothetical protein VFK06_06395 [Candidatus Angelobacter sp.]|nr:hypothetical protein [Candidatus Angelobacter sp.]
MIEMPFTAQFVIISALLVQSLSLVAQNTQNLATQLLAQPPDAATQLASQQEDKLKVDFVRADLDGSGKFQFIVAFYSLEHDDQGVFFRVFQQQQPSGLQVVGEQEDDFAHGGFGISVHLVDIQGDGIPEIEVQGHQSDGAQVFHEYFSWTEHSLHSSIDPTADSELEDIDGDGIQELVASNGDGSFNVYKYNGTDFTLLKTLKQDPDGVLGADGQVNIVRARFSVLKPHDFSIDEIRTALNNDKDNDKSSHDSGNDDADGRVQIIMGDLKDLHGKAFSVEDIDPTTLVLVRNLHPIRFKVRPVQSGEEGDDHKQGVHSVLQLEFARRGVLRLLPRLKLTAATGSR